MPNIQHQNFIDLMKAFGMLLIIFGHVIGDPENIYNELTQPAYTKQVGVAFFIFITGWGLANNSRPALRAVFNRILPFYFYGIIFTLLLSLFYLYVRGDINESNYLPFMLGINVFFNSFPANPTTWFIGTYLHILLFWYFFLQGKEIKGNHVMAAFVMENIFRCALLLADKDFIAYMMLPNWLTVFMLGMYFHKKQQLEAGISLFVLLAVWAGILTSQAFLMNTAGFDHSLPFRHMKSETMAAIPIESVLISCTYIIHTLFFFEIARRLPGHGMISLLARGTLITVIIHMPIIYETHKMFYGLFESKITARIVFIFTLFFGCAIIAELINRSLRTRTLNDRAWAILSGMTGSLRR